VSGCGGQMALEWTMGEWEPQHCDSTETVGQSTAAGLGQEEWGCSTQPCGHSELHFGSLRIHSTRANIHLSRVQTQTDLGVTIDGERTVGGLHVQQALRLQTEKQGQKQETHPNDKHEVFSNQGLKTKGEECTHSSIPEMLWTPRR